MTTNPPLTAERWLRAQYPGLDKDDTIHVPYVLKHLKAYAAQQNAEMVAENSRLMNESMDTKIKIDSLLFTNKNLQAENERLKQQLAWQPMREFKKEAGSYTFGMTVQFAAANDYTAFRSFNLEYTEEGDLMQEGDYFDEYELTDFQCFRPFDEPQPQPPKEAT